jgi:hypothetical protein
MAIRAYYRFNGNSNDASGNGNNGTDTNITYSQANGRLNQGAGFNGTSSRIVLGNVLNIGLNSLTLSTWFKLTSSNGNEGRALVGKGILTGSSNGGYGLYIWDNMVMAQLRYDAASLNSYIYDPTSKNDGKWHNAVLTLERNNETGFKLYVDTKLVASTTSIPFNSLTFQTTSYFAFGARSESTYPNNYMFFLLGSIDETKMMIGEVWSPAQIKNESARVKGFF